jgi:hypothetical protein
VSLPGQFGQRREDTGRVPFAGTGRGDGTGPAQRLREASRHLALGAQIAVGVVAEGPDEDLDDQDEQGHPDQHHTGGDDIGEGEGDQPADRRDDGGQRGGERHGHGPGLGGVSDEPRHEVPVREPFAGPRPGIEQMPQHRCADPGRRSRAATGGHHALHGPGQDGDRGEDGAQHHPPARLTVPSGQQQIEGPPGHGGQCECGGGHQHTGHQYGHGGRGALTDGVPHEPP